MRVEANVSIRPRGTETLGTRVEVKNMNSFRSVERAIAFEIERQTRALEAGEGLVQETRGWDDTVARRTRCGSRRSRRTTAISRSRICRRCARIRRGWPRSVPLCRSCQRPSERATHRLRTVGLRRLGDRRQRGCIFRRCGDRFTASPTQSRSRACCRRSACASRSRSRICWRVGPAPELAAVVALRASGEISSQNAEEVYAEHLRSGRAVADIVSERGLSSISDAGALGRDDRQGRRGKSGRRRGLQTRARPWSSSSSSGRS